MAHTWLFTRSEPLEPINGQAAHIYYNEKDATACKGFETQWADGGLVSTLHDCIRFLKSLNNGELIKDKANLERMHQWRKLQFPLQYGYGTMYVKMPCWATLFRQVPAIWGHSGSTGSFLYYCKELDLYMAGTLNQAKSHRAPFQVMMKMMNVVKKL